MTLRRVLAAVFLALASGSLLWAADDPEWRPVSAAERALTSGKIDPAADAEILLWDVRFDDKKLESAFIHHYVRAKIFTTRGRELFSKLDLPFIKGKKIERIAARIHKPDGSTIILGEKDAFEREIVRVGKVKVRSRSMALPVEPGSIVEYQFREVYKDAWGNGVRFVFQREVPIHEVVYRLRPQKGFHLRPVYYNMPETAFAEDPTDKGFYIARMTDVPAYKVEPFMPPEDEVRRWVYMTYTVDANAVVDPAVTWRQLNRKYHPWLSIYAKPTTSITDKARELTAGALNDEDKLRRIYEFIQKNIRNIDYDRLMTDEEREKLDHDHAEDTLRLGIGNSIYIELLFASLAMASGFEANLVFSGDRREVFFDPAKYPFPAFVHLSCTAVLVNGEWRYFNSSVPYLPFGYLTWSEEASPALLVSEKGFLWQKTPITEPERSPVKRSAKLKLDTDGQLSGDVAIEYGGQAAITRRRDLYGDSTAQKEEYVKGEVKARVETAVVSDIVIENESDNTKPLTFRYKIKIPNYASRTGKRLFLQPGYFEYGAKPLFSASTRLHKIHFSYPWAEEDVVDITLPAGAELESSDRPQGVREPKNIGSLAVSIGFDRASHTLNYRRRFHFGRGGSLLYPASAYGPLKNLFDLFHKADSHSLALRLAAE
jgi:transglutaminase-like putative cysteine protease